MLFRAALTILQLSEPQLLKCDSDMTLYMALGACGTFYFDCDAFMNHALALRWGTSRYAASSCF